jgi:hypothetical protein
VPLCPGLPFSEVGLFCPCHDDCRPVQTARGLEVTSAGPVAGLAGFVLALHLVSSYHLMDQVRCAASCERVISSVLPAFV